MLEYTEHLFVVMISLKANGNVFPSPSRLHVTPFDAILKEEEP
jgi:hypothetical protein